jgi:hypothetical protein
LLVSESYCRIAIVLFIYVSYTNKIFLYQNANIYIDKQTDLNKKTTEQDDYPFKLNVIYPATRMS